MTFLLPLLLACTEEAVLPETAGLHDPIARAEVGAPAPTFTLPSVTGEAVDLRDLRGRVVVLEWFSTECPFVDHAHSEGPLEEAPARWASQGVAWLAINSNAPGRPGSDQGQTRRKAERFDLPTAPLLDRDGAVGRAYGATVTPEIFVLDPDGVVAYHGSPDNAPLGSVSGGGEVRPWLDEALTAVTAGEAPRLARTKPWGCTIKY